MWLKLLSNCTFLGDKRPSRVRADVTVNLSVRDEIKNEWENLRKHDVCFLISVKPVNPIGKFLASCTLILPSFKFYFILGTKYDYKQPFIPQVGLDYVRGCEVEGMLDSNGRVIEDGPEPKPVIPGDQRTFRVWLDCNQYMSDMNNTNDGQEDVYESN